MHPPMHPPAHVPRGTEQGPLDTVSLRLAGPSFSVFLGRNHSSGPATPRRWEAGTLPTELVPRTVASRSYSRRNPRRSHLCTPPDGRARSTRTSPVWMRPANARASMSAVTAPHAERRSWAVRAPSELESGNSLTPFVDRAARTPRRARRSELRRGQVNLWCVDAPGLDGERPSVRASTRFASAPVRMTDMRRSPFSGLPASSSACRSPACVERSSIRTPTSRRSRYRPSHSALAHEATGDTGSRVR
jgi:hypothetical protein